VTRRSIAATKHSLGFVLAMSAVALAGQACAQQEAVHTIARFEFEGGAVLENMKVGYVTYGKRETDDANVVVLLPPTSGLKSWANAHIGHGRAFDTDKYYIVSIDSIGGGTSSQPRDGLGTRFPAYNIRDMVRAQHELLVSGLGMKHALAIGGASSGAYQALQWGILYPGFARGIMLYAGAPRATSHVKTIIDAIVATLSLDPAFTPSGALVVGTETVRRASTVYFPWLFSDGLLDTQSDQQLAGMESNFADIWARNWDAVGLSMRYKSNRDFDVAAPFQGSLDEALHRVTASVLILPVTTDRTHPIEMSSLMRDGLSHARVVYAPLDSIRGHSAVFRPPGTPEYDFVSTQTHQFLSTLKK